MRNPAAQGRADSNHGEIVKRYEEMFCNVLDLHKLGFGCPDILVAFSGWCGLREIKTEAGNLEPSQKRFMETWRGPKITVIRTIADVDNDVLNIRQQVSRGKQYG
jgi:hypothetical protein